MAIVRCERCGQPTRTKVGSYVASHDPIGHPETAAIKVKVQQGKRRSLSLLRPNTDEQP